MTFTENDKLTALAVVNIFETSRPFGDYAACVVLNDGAGVSYGINQFTHRSGSLAGVVETYLNNGGQVGKEILNNTLPTLKRRSAAAINKLSRDTRFKAALRAAAVTREMKDAQQHVAFEKYLQPAIETCKTREFVQPLSLAVVYDSLNHGSWERIAAKVVDADEKKWITEYVRARHAWLSSVARLKPTCYRTQFFLDQIAVGNWNLKLPMTVHGFRLTEAHLSLTEDAADESEPGGSPPARGGVAAASADGVVGAATGSILNKAGEAISTAADKFDRVDSVVTTVSSRSDTAKSLWTTIIGTIGQALWAIFGFLAGLPREVWIVVAVIAAALMLLFLYRQIEMGRIREQIKTGNQGG